jgi:hypothetical protein
MCANSDTTMLADVDGAAVADSVMNLAGIARNADRLPAVKSEDGSVQWLAAPGGPTTPTGGRHGKHHGHERQ